MERWWCIDCRTPVSLNRQARCERCDSDALDTMERLAGQSPTRCTELAVGAAVAIEVPAQASMSYKPWYHRVEQILVQAARTLNEPTAQSRLT